MLLGMCVGKGQCVIVLHRRKHQSFVRKTMGLVIRLVTFIRGRESALYCTSLSYCLLLPEVVSQSGTLPEVKYGRNSEKPKDFLVKLVKFLRRFLHIFISMGHLPKPSQHLLQRTLFISQSHKKMATDNAGIQRWSKHQTVAVWCLGVLLWVTPIALWGLSSSGMDLF